MISLLRPKDFNFSLPLIPYRQLRIQKTKLVQPYFKIEVNVTRLHNHSPGLISIIPLLHCYNELLTCLLLLSLADHPPQSISPVSMQSYPEWQVRPLCSEPPTSAHLTRVQTYSPHLTPLTCSAVSVFHHTYLL